MKNFILWVLLVLALGTVVFAESYRRTATDIYRESFEVQMRKQLGTVDVAGIRARQYREMIELNQVCDEHHNCSNDTEQARRAMRERDVRSMPHPVLNAPVWH